MLHGRLGSNMNTFYKDKIVLVTGNTGFKGVWLTEILLLLGAKVVGYALQPNTVPSLYEKVNLQKDIIQYFSDIRDFDQLRTVFEIHKPQIVFHLAAQPLVRDSYLNPRDTYDINVMGTVNLLECIKECPSVISAVNITTDKVYKNNEWDWGYREIDRLDGYDPYSNSKSCSELVTATYIRSFFNEKKVPVSTCRAGNVIGGGDYSKDRIIPDAIRALNNHEKLIIRNPKSIRPYQHVLEPLFAYLEIAMKQSEKFELASSYNIGPSEKDSVNTETLINKLNFELSKNNKRIDVEYSNSINVHEANYLKLDCSKVLNKFNWKPKWNIDIALGKITEFLILEEDKTPIRSIMKQQIESYYEGN